MGRKTTMMPTMSGGGTGRRLIAVVVAVALLSLVLRDPIGAANAVQQMAVWGGAVLDALSTFGSAVSK